MRKSTNTGSMDISYARERGVRKSSKYRLWRRTIEIISALQEFAPKPIKDIIDLGTADGRMIHSVKMEFPEAHCVGVEFNQELVDFGRSHFPEIEIVQGDVQALDFSDKSFDVALLTAVIEHVPAPEKVMCEANRILRPGGILVLTSPDPFWEYLATKVGHLKDGQHNKVMNIDELSSLIQQHGFTILKTKKFMLSPVGMPFEFFIEKWILRLHLGFIMANQLVISKC